MADKQLFFLAPPPRSTNDPKQDYPLIVDWLFQVYRGLTAYVQGQSNASDFNSGTLPDPASTNLATAQKTANQAYILANTAETNAAAAQTTATTATTNAATAQSTATAAASSASTAQGTATTANDRTKNWFAGQVTVAGGGTTGVHTFSGGESEADTNYHVLATAVSASGSPAAGSETILTITKATDKFTINVATDPGGATSVTFDFLVVRFP